MVGYNIKYNILYWELVGYNSKATLFNKAGLIYDEKRSKILSEKAEKLVYMCDIFESDDDDSRFKLCDGCKPLLKYRVCCQKHR